MKPYPSTRNLLIIAVLEDIKIQNWKHYSVAAGMHGCRWAWKMFRHLFPGEEKDREKPKHTFSCPAETILDV